MRHIAADAIGRAAFALLAARQLLLGYAALADSAPPGALVDALMIAAAVLITVSGAGPAPKSRRLVAAGMFVVVCVMAFGARSYADALLGKRSVLSPGSICQ